ncbi:phosphotransferase [Paenibacillus glycinis]|uniref:Phosphotransferase n=1 Tax=Paenibacillus glycinis TaxID=2697035 RepID=A0ABW9XPR0_9BACL|nr:phosphotransferase [Paenibacillus glycinis]NBD24634.1 phosphotransferase [Paenibacillus glycinis]
MKIGRLLGAGNTASVYEWGITEAIKILHDPIGGFHEAAKEARNAEMINARGLRTPRFSGMIQYEGKSCLIYEKVEGPTMLASIMPTTLSVSRHAKLMARLHDELHRVKIDIAANLKTELSKAIQMTEVITDQEKSQSIESLEALPDGSALCHYDFHPGNIILSPDGPVMIDWLNALVGNPYADVARTFMLINAHALPSNAPAWLRKREYRELFGEAYIAEYAKRSAMDRSDLEDWFVPTLAARLSELRGEDQCETLLQLRSRLGR